MIKLNELYFSDEDLRYTSRQVVVNMRHVNYMRPNVISCKAPREVDSLIYGDDVPKERYRLLDKTECTTLYFDSGNELDVIETIEEILQLMKED